MSDQTFGQVLLNTRTKREQTKTKAAAELGVARITYGRWEGEQRCPPVVYRAKIAEYVGLTVEAVNALIGGTTFGAEAA